MCCRGEGGSDVFWFLPELISIKSGRACLPRAGAFRTIPVRRDLISCRCDG